MTTDDTLHDAYNNQLRLFQIRIVCDPKFDFLVLVLVDPEFHAEHFYYEHKGHLKILRL